MRNERSTTTNQTRSIDKQYSLRQSATPKRKVRIDKALADKKFPVLATNPKISSNLSKLEETFVWFVAKAGNYLSASALSIRTLRFGVADCRNEYCLAIDLA